MRLDQCQQQMHEPAMMFDRIVLSPQKEVVRIFFKEMWDKADKKLIPNISIPTLPFVVRLALFCEGMTSLPVMLTW